MSKHYPEEWTDGKGQKQMTCVCGGEWPCPAFVPNEKTALSDSPNSIVRSRPTRRDLLIVLGRIQSIVGLAQNTAQNDRNPDRLVNLLEELEEARALSFDALQFDPPMDGKRSRNGWSEWPND